MRQIKTFAMTIVAIVTFSLVAAVVPASATPRPATGTQRVLSALAQMTPAKVGTLTSVVHGTFGKLGKVTGTFHPERFQVKNGKVYGVGMLSTKLTRNGTVLGHAHRYVAIPVRGGSGVAKKCDILDLLLGPLHLNLLGLHVDLKKVILHIVAHSGAGQLLGNLLCAVAHLLDGGPSHLLRLSNLLNRILSILRM
jgi:hypothetical protein